MKILEEKLQKEAEKVLLSKGCGFPTKAFIEYAVKKAETDEMYREKLNRDDFSVTLIYVAEYLIKEIVESENTGQCGYVSDVIAYQALDTWIMADEEKRNELIEVISSVKHPQSTGRNPFFDGSMFDKKHTDEWSEEYRSISLIAALLKKYYKEPPKKVEKSKTAAPKAKKTTKKEKNNQLSLELFDKSCNETEVATSQEAETGDTMVELSSKEEDNLPAEVPSVPELSTDEKNDSEREDIITAADNDSQENETAHEEAQPEPIQEPVEAEQKGVPTVPNAVSKEPVKKTSKKEKKGRRYADLDNQLDLFSLF